MLQLNVWNINNNILHIKIFTDSLNKTVLFYSLKFMLEKQMYCKNNSGLKGMAGHANDKAVPSESFWKIGMYKECADSFHQHDWRLC